MDYSLMLYNSVLESQSLVGNITEMASGWRRSIRFMGGYWLGSFTIYDEPISVLQDFFYTNMGGHIEEKSSGGKTWEGMIYEMDLKDDKADPSLFVKACGYVFTLNWRFIGAAAADDTTGNASAYISDLLDHYCEFNLSKRISTNTLQVYRHAEIDQRAWDEIKRITEMGDSNGDQWRFYMDNDRTAVYEEIDTEPRYYLRGGGIRRRSLDMTWNHVGGTYTDENGDIQTLGTAFEPDSVARYGQKEDRLVEHDQPQTAVERLRDVYLAERAYPWARPIGTTSDIELFTKGDQGLRANPWRVRPAVVRDYHYPVSRSESGSVLKDARDFIIDEVIAGVDSGLQFTTADFEEAEILEAQESLDYVRESGGGSQKPGNRREEKRWKKIGVSYDEWEKMSTRERRRRAREKSVKWW